MVSATFEIAAHAPRVLCKLPNDLSLEQEARLLRRDIVQALFKSGGGHYGGCLSVIDLLLTLYRHTLHICPENLKHMHRDRLILSKGHAALALYAILHRLGLLQHPLHSYAEFQSPLEGHPDMTSLPVIDFSTGSLGQGLSVGLGMAYAIRRRGRGERVWVILGDGECQEGQIWEAAMLAAQCGLANLHAVVDHNRYQEWGWAASHESLSPAPLPGIARKWQAFGWRTVECDGHDFAAMKHAIDTVTAITNQPSVIIANTVKGKGVPLIEQAPRRFHCETVSQDEHLAIMSSME